MAARHTQIVFSNLEDIHPTREGGEPPLANNSPTREDNPSTHWVNFTPVRVTLTPDGGEPPLAFFLFLYMKIILIHIG